MTSLGNTGGLLKTSAWSAIAAAIAMLALPVEASAEDQRGWRGGGDRSASAQRGRSSDFGQYRMRAREQSASRVENRGDRRAARIDQSSEQRAARVERSGDRAAWREAQNGNAQQARRIDRSTDRTAQRIERRGDATARTVERRSERRADAIRSGTAQRGDYSGSWQRNRSYRDESRNRSYRTEDRNRAYRQAQRSNDSWRDNHERWRDGDRRQAYSRDYRRWDRKWRNNSRYDWYRYRARNHNIYRVSRYYAPYRGYSYSRIGIGFSLGSMFYSSRYWIDDPWYYRLPEVYGPYRWVRYYDDVLLVNVYSGEVVDVIYDFFW